MEDWVLKEPPATLAHPTKVEAAEMSGMRERRARASMMGRNGVG